jgi:hypothetical protein
LIAFLF